MAGVEVKTFEKADEVNNNFNNAKIEAVKVGNQRVMKLTLQPGWKWSKDIKPTVGGDSCQATHLGVIVSGAVCAKHNDGTEITYKSGDAYAIQPGHDGWPRGAVWRRGILRPDLRVHAVDRCADRRRIRAECGRADGLAHLPPLVAGARHG